MTTGATASGTSTTASSGRSIMRTIGRILGLGLLWLALLLLNLWAVAAIYVDCRIATLRLLLAVIYMAVLILLIIKMKRRRALACYCCFCVVLVWWLTLRPTNAADWRADVARTAWADIDGNQVAVHNVRKCDY